MATGKIWSIVRINRDPKDTYAADFLGEAIELANPDDGDIVEFGSVRAIDAGAARLMKPAAWRELVKRGDDWWTKNPAKKVKATCEGCGQPLKVIWDKDGERIVECKACGYNELSKSPKKNPSFSVRREFDRLFKNSNAEAREALFAEMSFAEGTDVRRVNKVLEQANKMLGWRGVTTLHPAAKGYKDHVVGYYVDNGDTSRITLMYDLGAQMFVLGTPDELEGKWYRESGEYEAPIAYKLALNTSEWKAVEMMRGRYAVATILSKHENEETGEAEFSESDAWELAEAYEEEGAPNFAPKLENKIANFIERIV